MTKIATATIAEDTRVGGTVLEAGEYLVEMPDDYDPSLVTAEDIIHDGQVRIVDPDEIHHYAAVEKLCRVIEVHRSIHDAGHPEVAAWGSQYDRWVYVEEPCAVGDRLSIDAEGCAQIAEAIADESSPTTRCAYCGADVPDDIAAEAPGLHDDEEWAEVAQHHAKRCEWVLSRAHRIAIEEAR